MNSRNALRVGIACVMVMALAAPGLTSATHNPGNPRNDTANAGAMQCDTNAVPVYKAGATPAPPPVGHIRYIVYNQDEGHLRLEASGNALGNVGCTFGIQITGTSCTGLSPSCGIASVVESPCDARLSGCTAVTELDFWFKFQAPYATTHQYIYYDLVVWTGEQPFHVDPVVVASGVVEYYEPPNPTPVPLDGIAL